MRNDQNAAPATFAPWRLDFMMALFWWAAALIAAGLFYREWVSPLPAILLCGLLFLLGLQSFSRGCRRYYGHRVEQKALRWLKKKLPDAIETNVLVPGLGDIDAVYRSGSVKAAIEVKSWVRWQKKTWFGLKKRADDRTECAEHQAARAARYIHARFAIVWLPKAPEFVFRVSRSKGGASYVVGGNAILTLLQGLQ